MGEIVEFRTHALLRAESSLLERLAEFVSLLEGSVPYREAARAFWSCHTMDGTVRWDEAGGAAHSDTLEPGRLARLADRFRDWFLFDHRRPQGPRMIEEFGLASSAGMNSYERALLQDWSESYYGLFSVVDCGEGSSIVEDALARTRFIVRASAMPRCGEHDVVVARPLRVGETHRLAGVVCRLPHPEAESAIADLARKFARLKDLSSDLTVPEFYRLCGHLIDAVLP